MEPNFSTWNVLALLVCVIWGTLVATWYVQEKKKEHLHYIFAMICLAVSSLLISFKYGDRNLSIIVQIFSLLIGAGAVTFFVKAGAFKKFSEEQEN